jgi:hypothetical protein
MQELIKSRWQCQPLPKVAPRAKARHCLEVGDGRAMIDEARRRELGQSGLGDNYTESQGQVPRDGRCA